MIAKVSSDACFPALAPSLLAAPPLNLEKALVEIQAAGVKRLHIDVMDGHFVPNLALGVETVIALSKQPNLQLDVHLMIDPIFPLANFFLELDLSSLTVHVEALGSDPLKTLERLCESGIEIGFAIKPRTPVEALFPFLDTVHHVVIMTVEPGFGGQAFQKEPLEKIAVLKQKCASSCVMHVDGGVGEQNIELCVEKGADVLVVGTAVFQNNNIQHNIEHLKRCFLQRSPLYSNIRSLNKV